MLSRYEDQFFSTSLKISVQKIENVYVDEFSDQSLDL